MVLDMWALLAILLDEPESEPMVAMAEREPLLFKGNDFGRTDVSVVSY